MKFRQEENMKRKFLIVFFSLIMLLMSAAAFAACGPDSETGGGPSGDDPSGDDPSGDDPSLEKPDGLEFVLSEDGQSYEVSGIGTITDTRITVPAEYDGKPVTGVHEYAFDKNAALSEVVLPDSVTKIGPSAFSDCGALGSVTMSSVTDIGESAFSGCAALTEIDLSAATDIGANAFQGCSALTEVFVPAGVAAVEESTFADCTSLASVTFAEGVQSIASQAFGRCTSLTELLLPDSVTYIGAGAFEGCSSLTEITLPFVGESAEGNSFLGHIFGGTPASQNVPASLQKVIVTSASALGQDAFAGCSSLRSVVLPETLVSVGDRAFEGCAQLAELTLPQAVTQIGVQAFDGCVSLETLDLPDGLQSIGTSAFRNCTGIASFVLPQSVREIGSDAFAGCSSLVSLTLPFLGEDADWFGKLFGAGYYMENGQYVPQTLKTVSVTGGTAVADFLFYGCASLEEVTLPSSVTRIGNSSFCGCASLTDFVLPASLTDIGPSAFKDCAGLSALSVPAGVTSIGAEAFFGCTSLQEADLGGALSVGADAFAGCTSLQEVLFGTEFAEMGQGAFRDCTSLTQVALPNSLQEAGSGAFSGCTSLSSLTLPFLGQSREAVSENRLEYLFGPSSAQAGESVPASLQTVVLTDIDVLPAYAFEGCASVRSVSLPDTVTGIGEYAFSRCASLSGFVIPSAVREIGEYAFSNCAALTQLSLSDSVEAIGENALEGCSSLEELTLPFLGAGAEETEDSHFGYLFGAQLYSDDKQEVPASLAKVTLTGGPLPRYAFAGCRFLEEVVLPEDLGSVGEYAFSNCVSLQTLSLPAGVTSIGAWAFNNCAQLSACTLPSGLKEIGNGAFSQCALVEEMTVPSALEKMGSGVFSGCTSLSSLTLPFLGLSAQEPETLSYLFGDVPSSLRSVALTGGTALAASAFSQCASLTEIALPETLTSVGAYAFGGCSLLQEIVLPDSVAEIGDSAFYGCSSLTAITLPFAGASAQGGENTHFGYIFGAVTYRENADSLPQSLRSVTLTGGESIGARAFYGCDRLREISLPKTLRTVGEDAFSLCTSLEKVTAEEMAAWCGISFANASANPLSCAASLYCGGEQVTSLRPTDGISSIAPYAFYGYAALTDISFGADLLSVGAHAFENCTGLTQITLPDGVESVGQGAFAGCSSLTVASLPFVGGGAEENTFLGYIFGAENHEQNGACVPASLREVTVTGGGVPEYAFYGCVSLVSVSLPEDTALISRYAFANCLSLADISLPAGVTEIGSSVFYGCSSLKEIALPAGLTDIGSYAFSRCSSLVRLVLPNSVKSVGQSAFSWCSSLVSLTLGSDLSEISADAFRYCYKLAEVYNLSALTLSEGSQEQGCAAYYALNVYTPTEGESFLSETQEGYLFFDDGETAYLLGYTGEETSLTLPATCNGRAYAVYHHAFYGREELTDVLLPEGLTGIGTSAFSGCGGLSRILIPASVQTIGDFAFSSCAGISEIELGDGVREIGSSAFSGTSILYLDIPDSVLRIGEGAFSGCTTLVRVTLGSGVTSVESNAFADCSKLEEVYNFSSLELVAGSAENGGIAYYAKNVYTPTAGESILTTQDGFVFSRRGNEAVLIGYEGTQADVVLPASFEGGTYAVGEYAFYKNTSLTSVTIPAGVTAVGKYAFAYCANLRTAVVGSDVTGIGQYAFYGCNALQSLSLPFAGERADGTGSTHFGFIFGADTYAQNERYVPKALRSVTVAGGNIAPYAFADCGGIVRLTLGSGVLSVGAEAFRTCYRLAEVVNLSSLALEAGSQENGCVALYARAVYTSADAESKVRETEDGFLYFVGEEGLLLFGYAGGRTEVALPELLEGETYILASYAFAGLEDVEEVTVPNGVRQIERYAFYGSSLQSLSLPYVGASPDGEISHFGYIFGAETYGENLTSVPASLQQVFVSQGYIAENAFRGCESLLRVSLGSGVDGVQSYAFGNCSSLQEISLCEGLSRIENYAFIGCGALQAISLPASVSYLGDGVFQNCTSLGSIVLPDALTSVPSFAFSGCISLAEVTFGDGILSIGNNAFEHCSRLAELSIPEGVTDIGSYAFDGCTSLVGVRLPASLAQFDLSVFQNCSSLREIVVAEDNPAYSSAEGVLFNKDKSEVVLYPAGRTITSYIVPAGVLSVGAKAFRGNLHLKDVILPEGLESLGENAFDGCLRLESIALPASLRRSDAAAFTGCTALAEVYISDVAAWCGVLFADAGSNPLACGATLYVEGSPVYELVIPEGVESVGDYAFYGYSPLVCVTLGKDVTSVGAEAFRGCYKLAVVYNFSALAVTAGSQEHGYVAFYAVNVFTSEGEGAFTAAEEGFLFYRSGEKVSLIGYTGDQTSLVLPASFEGGTYEIYPYAFYNDRSLTSVTVPAGVTAIGANAFAGCTSLRSISLPFVGENAEGDNNFLGYIFGAQSAQENRTFVPSSLTSVTVTGGVLSENAFGDCGGLRSVTVSGVAEIPAGVFSYCTGLQEVNIGAGVSAIGSGAFSQMNIERLVLGDDVVTIGASAFSQCNSLQEVTFGSNVTTIEANAFLWCERLRALVLPDSVTSIGERAFEGCSVLSEVTLGADLSEIGAQAFRDCYRLTEVYNRSALPIAKGSPEYGGVAQYAKNVYTDESGQSILRRTEEGFVFAQEGESFSLVWYEGTADSVVLPDSFEGSAYSVAAYAFSRSDLSSVTIPNGVTAIGERAFERCVSLHTVQIGSGVTAIGDYAFYNCSSLQNVTIGADVSTIGNYAFSGCSALEEIYLPASVSSIGDDAFSSCTRLENIDVAAENAVYSSSAGVLFDKDKSELLLFPCGRQRTIYVLPSSVTVIGEGAFRSCTGLLGVTLPAGLLTIGADAFNGCTSLEEIVLPASLHSIGYAAFGNCSGLDRAVFEAVSGWQTLAGEQIPQNDLADASLAAQCLTGTYCYSDWSRKA